MNCSPEGKEGVVSKHTFYLEGMSPEAITSVVVMTREGIMGTYVVTCIVKPDPHDRFSRITHVGLRPDPGSVLSQGVLTPAEDVIRRIKLKTDEFWTVLPNGRKVRVIVGHRGLSEYLKTEIDNTESNNLLSLDQCNHIRNAMADFDRVFGSRS